MDKVAQLCCFLRERAAAREKTIVFVLTCASVDYYGSVLASPAVRLAMGLQESEAEFPILPLHGQMAPKKRTGIYDRFLAAPSGALICTDVGARGIDVPDVDWIAQFDPPKDASFFIHRVGRTARAGRRGQAIVFLLPKERGYVQLLGVKQVPILERPRVALEGELPDDADAGAANADVDLAMAEGEEASEEAAAESSANEAVEEVDGDIDVDVDGEADEDDEVPEDAPPMKAGAVTVDDPVVGRGYRAGLVGALKAESLGDRDVLEIGTKAFISFVRGYKEHICRFIFRLEQLPIVSLALSFGLVKMPKVDEFRGKELALPGPKVDTFRIAYKNPKREAQRQLRLAADADKLTAERQARDDRRDKALAEAARRAALEKEERRRKRKHKGMQARIFEDWELLQREEAIERRLKAGKISKKQYKIEMARVNREMGLKDDEGDDIVDTALMVDGKFAARKSTGAAGGDDSDSDSDDSSVENAQPAGSKRSRAQKKNGGKEEWDELDNVGTVEKTRPQKTKEHYRGMKKSRR
jgi:ATP-dependent RNA helicase DDX55/SPB4